MFSIRVYLNPEATVDKVVNYGNSFDCDTHIISLGPNTDAQCIYYSSSLYSVASLIKDFADSPEEAEEIGKQVLKNGKPFVTDSDLMQRSLN